MIPYLSCQAARGMLDRFVDGELPMADQVVVEAHLRWCDTCLARVDDLRLIGAALRLGSAASAVGPDQAAVLSVMQSEVVARIDAERGQSYAVRLQAMFADMRFLWPALGATLALVLCLHAVSGVYGVARAELLAIEPRVAAPSEWDVPAVDRPGEEAVFLLSEVVTRGGRVATYELLRSGREPSYEVSALLDALQYSRVAPSGMPPGSVVNVVWVLARTTVKGSAHGAGRDKPVSGAPAPRARRPAHS